MLWKGLALQRNLFTFPQRLLVASGTNIEESEPMESNVLRRLRRVAAKHTLLLTHYGRKSGKPYDVTIWFVVDGEKVYIGTANVRRQWVRNVQKTPQVKLSIGREKFDGTARFLADQAEHERAMAAIRRKYWMYRPFIVLGQILTAIGVMRYKTGSFEVTLAG
jgi:deazaflavin-dependent oxidoreductase (nitroreductase family)